MLNKKGFTLVEVIASIGIFAIAFLIGASAISTFMLKQEESYQRIVAASAAMLVVDSCYRGGVPPGASATGPNLTGGISGVLAPVPAGWWSKTRFKGGPRDILGSGDSCFVFDRTGLTASKTSAGDNSLAIGGVSVNLAECKSLVVTISKAVHIERNQRTVDGNFIPSPEGIDWRRMTFWYGYTPDLLGSKNTTVTFLGTYLYADGIHDL